MNTPIQCKLCPENDSSNFRFRTIKNIIYYVKYCRICEARQSLEYYHHNKEKRKQYQKSYIKKNIKKIKVKKKIYDRNRYDLHKEKILDWHKKYRKENNDKINSRKRNRRNNDPSYRLRYYVSNRICKILKKSGNKKNTSCLKYLDYSFNELKSYIESLFESWMNWDNHGNYDPKIWNDNDQSTWTWQLDHIIPQSELLYTSMQDDNFKKCWSLNNLRPLSARTNVIDGVNRKRHAR